MFSLFKKKPAPVYPSESKWNVSTGSHDGRAMIVRRNQSATDLIGHVDYAHRVGFAMPLLTPNEDGLPTGEESSVLNEIEDALADSIETGQDGLLTVIVTTSGMREFVFYTRKPGDIESVATAIRQAFPSYDIQFYIASDKNWDGYKQFL